MIRAKGGRRSASRSSSLTAQQVIELIRVHGTNETDIVGAGTDMRQEIAHLHTTFAIPEKLRGVPINLADSFFKKAKLTFSNFEGGSGWPCSRLSSVWDRTSPSDSDRPRDRCR